MDGDSLLDAVAAAVDALRPAADRDWRRVDAGPVEWSCLATAEHVVSDLVAYAGQLAGQAKDRYFPYEVTLERDAGPDDALDAVEAGGALLAAAVRTAPRRARGFHPFPFRSADREGFAAMGIAEVVLHTHDMATGLDVPYEAEAGLCAGLLAALFPHVRPGSDPWRTLLWATGRGRLPDREPVTTWHWYNRPAVPTGRLSLESITPAAAFELAAGGPGGFDWVPDGPFEGTRGAARMLLKQYETGALRPQWGMFAVVREADGLAVGAVGFHGVPDADGRAEIGYDLAESARGLGYATEALRALTAWGLSFDETRLVQAGVEPANVPSQRVLERAGYRHTGTTDHGNLRYEFAAPDNTDGVTP
jgi:RimJ/RimL family protein N-acetyltransferase